MSCFSLRAPQKIGQGYLLPALLLTSPLTPCSSILTFCKCSRFSPSKHHMHRLQSQLPREPNLQQMLLSPPLPCLVLQGNWGTRRSNNLPKLMHIVRVPRARALNHRCKLFPVLWLRICLGGFSSNSAMYLTVWLWLNYLDALSFSFFCKTWKTILYSKTVFLWLRWNNTHKSSWHTEGTQ